jgi:hypothetical protein
MPGVELQQIWNEVPDYLQINLKLVYVAPTEVANSGQKHNYRHTKV